MEIEITVKKVPKLGSIYFATNKNQPDVYVNDIKSNFYLYPTIIYILNACKSNLFSSRKKFIDIGSNIGVFTIPIAKNGIKTLSVEALPENFTLLSEAIKKNKLRNVIAVHAAAIDKSGHGVTVPALTIDTLAETYGFMDANIIKMDVEGAELSVCVGMKTLLANQPNIEIIFEANAYTCGLFGYSIKKLKKFFNDLGYQLYAFNGAILSPASADSFQPAIVLDYLATKKKLKDINGLVIRKQSNEEIITTMLQDIQHSIHHQAYFMSNIPFLPAYIKENTEIKSAIQKLSFIDTLQWHAIVEILKRGMEI